MCVFILFLAVCGFNSITEANKLNQNVEDDDDDDDDGERRKTLLL